MSKQKKTKQPPVLGRLLEYAGGHKWLSVLGCGLSGVSAAAGIFPFVFVWYAARGILTPGGGVSAGLARYGWYALAAALLSAAIYFAGLMCTHLAAFRVATNMRKAAAAHLIDLPLGYFNANLTGRLRKQIDDNAALTETLLAHTIPDAVGGIVTPILAVGLLFAFDWRMGLACLIPMIIGLVCLMSMMTGRGMKFFEEYQRAGERISAEATEYVRGIPVVKVFQQTVYSFKSFHAAILSYRDLASGYAMMCRMPYTLFTVVLNAMFLLLMPLGMVLIGSAADGWAVLADLVFYIFFAPQLAFMMERLMYADGEPMVLLVDYFPPHLFIEDDETFDGALYRVLRDKYGVRPVKSCEQISALSGGPIGLKLQLPREGAILCRRRRVLDSTGRLVQLQTLYYRAERFVCQIDLN